MPNRRGENEDGGESADEYSAAMTAGTSGTNAIGAPEIYSYSKDLGAGLGP